MVAEFLAENQLLRWLLHATIVIQRGGYFRPFRSEALSTQKSL